MNVTLTYTFSLYDEQYEFETLLAASSMNKGMHSFEDYLRSFKHRELTKEEDKLFEEIKEKYYEGFEEAHAKLGDY